MPCHSYRTIRWAGHEINRVGSCPPAGVDLSTGDWEAIAGAAQAFNGWLKTHFSPTAVHREMPVLGLDARGSVVSGGADIVAQARPDKPVLGVAVHWIMHGCMAMLPMEAAEVR